jgi:ketosteroid isomerase-like protein
MTARRLIPAALIATAIGCAQPAPPPAKPDAAAVKAGIAAYWAKWAVADTSNNINNTSPMMTPDFAFDVTGAPSVRGRSTWASMATGMMKDVKTTSFAVAPSDDWADGDHWYEQGHYTEGHLNKGKPDNEWGRYLAVFQKDSTSTLLLSRIMVISDSTRPVKAAKTPAKAAPTKAPAKAATKAPARKAPSKKSGD